MTVTQGLLDRLKDSSPAVRIDTLRILAILEETQALPVFRTMLKSETDPSVVDVLKWAGNVIWAAQQRGYTTTTAIAAHFRLHLTQSDDEKREAEKLKMLQQKLDIERLKQQSDSQGRQIGSTLAMGALGTVLGGPGMGAGMMISSAMNAAAGNASPEYGPRPEIGAQPIPVQRPADTDITIWVRRLRDPDGNRRRNALNELSAMNNPAALAQIAEVFATDPDPQTKEVARRAAKNIYFNWVQWEVERTKPPATPSGSTAPVNPVAADNTINVDKASAPGSTEVSKDQALRQTNSNVADILAKAKAAKEARKTRQ